MNNQPEPSQLIKQYKATFISLARHYIEMSERSAEMRSRAEVEPIPGRRSGLFCHAKVIGENAARLKELLRQDREILMVLFGTDDLKEISNRPKEIAF